MARARERALANFVRISTAHTTFEKQVAPITQVRYYDKVLGGSGNEDVAWSVGDLGEWRSCDATGAG